MSDFLSNLIARSLGDTPAIQPRLPSHFESAADLFAESQSPAIIATNETSSPLFPTLPIPKLSAADQTGMEKPIENATVDSLAEKQQSHINEPVTPFRPSATPSPIRSVESSVEPQTKKTVVPITSVIDEKIHSGKSSTNSLRKPFDQPSLSSRRQNSFSSIEPRPSARTIHVTIGRVEVRAIQSSTPAPKQSNPAAPKLSLDHYLQNREGDPR